MDKCGNKNSLFSASNFSPNYIYNRKQKKIIIGENNKKITAEIKNKIRRFFKVITLIQIIKNKFRHYTYQHPINN